MSKRTTFHIATQKNDVVTKNVQYFGDSNTVFLCLKKNNCFYTIYGKKINCVTISVS